jgi:HAD superfamily phosphoserine phosphatase-like hydrolase
MTTTRRLEVSIDDQRLDLVENGRVLKSYVVSTAAKGMGFDDGSFRTPTGNFRILEKIGAGEPTGTIFKARVPVGRWQPGDSGPEDGILTRILRLEGLDPQNLNTSARHIYIHGTNREDLLGSPASHGCVRMANADIIELHDLVAPGDEVVIHPAIHRRGGLFFIDCDSTLSSIEGIDELARAKGPAVFAEVASLTDAAMNGEIPIHDVFPKRMEIIRPDRATCDHVASLYVDTIVPGAVELVAEIRARGWTPVILSGGFAPLIQPLARRLGIDHVEAVPLYLHEDGSYAGHGSDYPTTRNLGKNEIIRAWRAAMLPCAVLMMGDGVSDLETKPDVDAFIGFGGVVDRKRIREQADYWLEDMTDLSVIRDLLDRHQLSGSGNR